MSEFITRVGGGEYQVIFKTNSNENYHAVEDFCREIIDHGKPSGWISVKDRLPESAGLKVLVAAKSDESVIQTMAVFTAFLGYGDWKWYTQDVGFMKNAKLRDNEIHPCWTITHWMLPPEPPKEET